MTLKDAVQILKIVPPITRGQLTKAYVDGLAEWHPDRVAAHAVSASEAEEKLRHIAEAHGMLNGLPETGYPFKVSSCSPKAPAAASGIQRPLQDPRIAAEVKPLIVVSGPRVPSPLVLTACVIVGAAIMGLAGMLVHILGTGGASPKAAEASAPPPDQEVQPPAPAAAPRLAVASEPATQMSLVPAAGKALSFDELQRRALEGDQLAQWQTAQAYERGEGVKANVEEAFKWTLMAAEQGLAAAQMRAGLCYKNGEGVPKDPAEALKWLKMASAAGLEEASREAVLRISAADTEAPVVAQPPAGGDRSDFTALHIDNFRKFGGRGQFILENGLVDDAYVKLVGGRKLWASFYVRGGGTFTLDNVPDGTYQVIYCTGLDWDPKARDFGRDQHALRHDHALDFATTRRIEGTQSVVSTPVLTLKLDAVASGTTPASDIPLEEFNSF